MTSHNRCEAQGRLILPLSASGVLTLSTPVESRPPGCALRSLPQPLPRLGVPEAGGRASARPQNMPRSAVAFSTAPARRIVACRPRRRLIRCAHPSGCSADAEQSISAAVSVDSRRPRRLALRAACGSLPSGYSRRLGAFPAKYSTCPLVFFSAIARVLPRRPSREVGGLGDPALPINLKAELRVEGFKMSGLGGVNK